MFSMLFIRSFHNKTKIDNNLKKSSIWVYDIEDLSLVKEAPFQTKSMPRGRW
jgi:hypothetical protein